MQGFPGVAPLRRHVVGARMQAYGLPLFYAYDGDAIFFNSRPGEKDEFLQSTTEGCFVVVEVKSDDDWTSVEARGNPQRRGKGFYVDDEPKAAPAHRSSLLAYPHLMTGPR